MYALYRAFKNSHMELKSNVHHIYTSLHAAPNVTDAKTTGG